MHRDVRLLASPKMSVNAKNETYGERVDVALESPPGIITDSRASTYF
jgi:hypothetical protein